MYPGVGSRTSVSDFIPAVTCSLSEKPPTPLCPYLPPKSSIFDSGRGESVTISISLDSLAWETSWVLTDATQEEVYFENYPGMYDGQATVQQEVFLTRGETYVFTIRDAGGNGIATNSAYSLQMSTGESLVDGTGDFGSFKEIEFTVPGRKDDVGDAGLSIPNLEPGARSGLKVYLQLSFDDGHEELAWKLSAVDDDSVVYGQALQGTYLAGGTVTEEIVLPGIDQYQFTIEDLGGSAGIIDSFSYRLFMRVDGQTETMLLEESGNFGTRKTIIFQIPDVNRPGCPKLPFYAPCQKDSQCCSGNCNLNICRKSSTAGGKQSVFNYIRRGRRPRGGQSG